MKKLVKFGKDFGPGHLVCAILLAGWEPRVGAWALEAIRIRSFDFYQRLRPQEPHKRRRLKKLETIQAFQRGVCSG